MGNQQSGVEGEREVHEGSGYRVFNLYHGSPAYESGLEVYFDYIVALNEQPVDGRQTKFFATIAAHKDKDLPVTVYSSKFSTFRKMTIKPRQWGGEGLLGATIRYDSYNSSEYNNIRVTEVFENSPAEMAGIQIGVDFLLGAEGALFKDLQDLVELVAQYVNKCISIYVYNVDSDEIRVVPIVPSTKWGGRGLLGCEFGIGLLHRIPDPKVRASKLARLQSGGDAQLNTQQAGTNAQSTEGGVQSTEGGSSLPSNKSTDPGSTTSTDKTHQSAAVVGGGAASEMIVRRKDGDLILPSATGQKHANGTALQTIKHFPQGQVPSDIVRLQKEQREAQAAGNKEQASAVGAKLELQIRELAEKQIVVEDHGTGSGSSQGGASQVSQGFSLTGALNDRISEKTLSGALNDRISEKLNAGGSVEEAAGAAQSGPQGGQAGQAEMDPLTKRMSEEREQQQQSQPAGSSSSPGVPAAVSPPATAVPVESAAAPLPVLPVQTAPVMLAGSQPAGPEQQPAGTGVFSIPKRSPSTTSSQQQSAVAQHQPVPPTQSAVQPVVPQQPSPSDESQPVPVVNHAPVPPATGGAQFFSIGSPGSGDGSAQPSPTEYANPVGQQAGGQQPAGQQAQPVEIAQYQQPQVHQEQYQQPAAVPQQPQYHAPVPPVQPAYQQPAYQQPQQPVEQQPVQSYAPVPPVQQPYQQPQQPYQPPASSSPAREPVDPLVAPSLGAYLQTPPVVSGFTAIAPGRIEEVNGNEGGVPNLM